MNTTDRRQASGALVAAVGAALAFVVLTALVLAGAAAPVDRALSLSIHALAAPALGRVMRIFTFLGSLVAVACWVAVIAAWALRRGARRAAAVLVGTATITKVAEVCLKLVFQRPRPDLFSEIIAPTSYSFPSGHAMLSIAAYGMMAAVAAQLQPKWRWPLYVAALLLVFCIGLSRIYLGVHWPSDVLAGFAAGGVLLMVALGSLRSVQRRDPRDGA